MRKILFQNADYEVFYDFDYSCFIISNLNKKGELVSTKYFHKLIGYFRDIEGFTLLDTQSLILEVTTNMFAVTKDVTWL